MAKITKATFKSFINKNKHQLLINEKSTFDGMVDCVMPCKVGFAKAEPTTEFDEHQLGFKGIWLVGSSRDYFSHFETDSLIGINVYNCCGNFIVAIEKQKQAA